MTQEILPSIGIHRDVQVYFQKHAPCTHTVTHIYKTYSTKFTEIYITNTYSCSFSKITSLFLNTNGIARIDIKDIHCPLKGHMLDVECK